MDITPVIPKGQNVIKGYGNMTFKVNDDEHNSSIIVLPEEVFVWQVESHQDISVNSFNDVISYDELEILLIGCGLEHKPLDSNIAIELQKKGVGVEIMTTGAACRTYNVLLAEGRKVAAALIPV
ncbi:MAG: Mth938-like domain-containing protein [Rickettsiales bacterium]|nr:Mth938-like domain-containing protein [Pseudomonadota bacterium]MDA0965540.1 Mth938-like domain-containing protein [Pseudomonadota bacterium]MDG4542864.1 Mth938-like domain-containing protein [Rickettsiales bacterium]MDG4544688.1 Mth938-like domain-containing protein [Rickettsiales bacterium]MDG4546810.1 Mth938-like domain-containing protein [Rickettsiales bacterium]